LDKIIENIEVSKKCPLTEGVLLLDDQRYNSYDTVNTRYMMEAHYVYDGLPLMSSVDNNKYTSDYYTKQSTDKNIKIKEVVEI
jgi:hypothetical protein